MRKVAREKWGGQKWGDKSGTRKVRREKWDEKSEARKVGREK